MCQSEAWTSNHRKKVIFYRVLEFAKVQWKQNNDFEKQFDLTFCPIQSEWGDSGKYFLLRWHLWDQGGLLLDSKACWDRKSTEEYCNGWNFFVVFINYWVMPLLLRIKVKSRSHVETWVTRLNLEQNGLAYFSIAVRFWELDFRAILISHVVVTEKKKTRFAKNKIFRRLWIFFFTFLWLFLYPTTC